MKANLLVDILNQGEVYSMGKVVSAAHASNNKDMFLLIELVWALCHKVGRHDIVSLNDCFVLTDRLGVVHRDLYIESENAYGWSTYGDSGESTGHIRFEAKPDTENLLVFDRDMKFLGIILNY